MHGRKTKIGCMVIVLSAALYQIRPEVSVPVFMLGTAIAFHGLYDRGRRNHEEIKKRTKRPTLRGGA